MVISRTSGLLVGGLLSAIVSATIAIPVANADPCNTTVGQTAGEQVNGYLDRHPDVRAQLQARAGSGTDLTDYLNRHPDVRQALITLANQCTS